MKDSKRIKSLLDSGVEIPEIVKEQMRSGVYSSKGESIFGSVFNPKNFEKQSKKVRKRIGSLFDEIEQLTKEGI